ncbi:MAG TPA: hypothetical protein PLS03_02255 [Terrimicrobiaceae bacterium]|nr:hypothetical protein [Terrimicrobiaceae bacterium]
MGFPQQRSRLIQYLRYQSRYGYEPFVLTFGVLAVIVTGVLMWLLLAPGTMP